MVFVVVPKIFYEDYRITTRYEDGSWSLQTILHRFIDKLSYSLDDSVDTESPSFKVSLLSVLLHSSCKSDEKEDSTNG